MTNQPSTPISDEIVEAAALHMSSVARIYYGPQIDAPHMARKFAHAALTAALPALRRQIAEEIAPVLEEFLGKPAGVMAAEITRRLGRGESL